MSGPVSRLGCAKRKAARVVAPVRERVHHALRHGLQFLREHHNTHRASLSCFISRLQSIAFHKQSLFIADFYLVFKAFSDK